MEIAKSKNIGLMLTSYQSGATVADVLKQICRVATVYFGFALAGAIALILSYVLAGLFSGVLFVLMTFLASLVLFVGIGVLVVYLDPELHSRFMSSRKEQNQEKANTRTLGVGGH